MVANLKAGKLPTGGALPESIVSLQTMRLPDGVNVEREGRAVVFRAWPYRNVLFSAWEFLRRQGVVWAYPNDHGDRVPAGKGVNLGILPLHYRPSAEWRCARFETLGLHLYPWTEQFLFFARNGYESSGQTLEQFLNQHNEVPTLPQQMARGATVQPDHKEGFDGYPHNFAVVIPNRILAQHPDWCGMDKDGQRLPPDKGGPSTFCMTSPGAIDFVADKMLDWVGGNKDCRARFNLLPMDGCRYCQCEACQKMYQPYERPEIPYVPGMAYMVSEAYYYFVSEVAKRVGAKAPLVRIGALAYADAHAPPRKIDRLPDNVWVDVVQYGSRNLPMSSPANAAMRQCMETWAKKCSHLAIYEYALIEGEWMELPMPVPLVSAIVDRSKFLYQLGAWNGGSQSWVHCLPHNPWNHYAYARMLWDANLSADQILDEFFTAYYGEARAPMLAYYKTLEDHLTRNNIDLQNFGYDEGPNPAAFPPEIVAALRQHLDKAGKAAKSWYVKQRVRLRRKTWIGQCRRRCAGAWTRRRPCNTARENTSAAGVRAQSRLTASWMTKAGRRRPSCAGFIRPKTFKAVPAEAQTEFRMVWDDEYIYIALRCANANIVGLKETEAIWGANMDSVEWNLAPEHAYTAAYYQMAVSAFNRSVGPGRYLHDQWHKEDWEPKGLVSAVQRGDGFWTCEMALPLKAFKEGAPKVGDRWRVNVARNYPGGASSGAAAGGRLDAISRLQFRGVRRLISNPCKIILIAAWLSLAGWAVAQNAARADHNTVNTVAHPGGMMADSPVTFPKGGPIPAKFRRMCANKPNPAEAGCYIFSSPCRSLAQIARRFSPRCPGRVYPAVKRLEVSGPNPASSHRRRRTAPAGGWGQHRQRHDALRLGGEAAGSVSEGSDQDYGLRARRRWLSVLQGAGTRRRVHPATPAGPGLDRRHQPEEHRQHSQGDPPTARWVARGGDHPGDRRLRHG